MSEYQDYGWQSAEPSNGAEGKALAEVFRAAAINLGQGLRVCDLGCGNGYLAATLADAGFSVLGVDASAKGIALARANFPQAEFWQTELDGKLAQTIGRDFDLVVSSDVIEHLYRPGDLLQDAHAILKPHGHLLLGTPYHGYWKNLVLSLTGKMDNHFTALWDGGHIKFFSVKSLQGLLAQHKFNVNGWSYHGRLPYLWKNMVAHASKQS